MTKTLKAGLLLAATATSTLFLSSGLASAKPAAAPTSLAVNVTAPASPFKKLARLSVRVDRSAPGHDGLYEVFVTYRNLSKEQQQLTGAGYRLSGVIASGSYETAEQPLYLATGERSDARKLPYPFWIAPNGGEVRVRYVFKRTPHGPLTVTDGSVSQTFTPAG
jgi:hypothetical protein